MVRILLDLLHRTRCTKTFPTPFPRSLEESRRSARPQAARLLLRGIHGRVSRKPDRDRSLELHGFLNDLQGWEHLLKEKDQRMKGQSHVRSRPGSLRNAGKVDEHKGPLKKVPADEVKSNAVSEVSSRNLNERYNYLKYPDAVSRMSSNFYSEENLPDAASEKELGNEFFRQKKFLEAIECYSRSIALSPTSVAFANRAMAYLKLKRFEEAENDCTEALNLDDRYVKAYSRRATARKELGKLIASMEDSEFTMRLEPNNQELRKQYTETKALYEKGSKGKKHDQPLIGVKDTDSKSTEKGTREHLVDESRDGAGPSSSNAITKKDQVVGRKHELKTSMQELASRAASRVMATAGKSITAPKTAYEFEVSWRALSDDYALQTQLLKTIPPATLPQIFKNALSSPILMDIIKCTATFFKEDTELAISILDNLAKVPRFDMIVMCLSVMDRSELRRIWEEVFSGEDIAANHMETLGQLCSRYCYGDWQDHMHGSNGWPK